MRERPDGVLEAPAPGLTQGRSLPMPKATDTHTPNPIVVALQIAAGNLSTLPAAEGGRLTYQDAILREACDAARVTQRR